MPTIECKRISKAFGDVHALDAVSLTVEHGKLLVLQGPSASGKSTLLRIIAGLEQPDSGDVLFDDVLVSNRQTCLSPRRRGIGMVFQGLALWPHLTVAKHLDFVLKAHVRSRRERHKRIAHWLQFLHLDDRTRAYPHQLSGGQRQRVALARALCINPAVLLLDEPLAGLDRTLRDEVRRELARIRLSRNLTVLYVTHYPEEVTDMADRVLRLEAGRLVDADGAAPTAEPDTEPRPPADGSNDD